MIEDDVIRSRLFESPRRITGALLWLSSIRQNRQLYIGMVHLAERAKYWHLILKYYLFSEVIYNENIIGGASIASP